MRRRSAGAPNRRWRCAPPETEFRARGRRRAPLPAKTKTSYARRRQTWIARTSSTSCAATRTARSAGGISWASPASARRRRCWPPAMPDLMTAARLCRRRSRRPGQPRPPGPTITTKNFEKFTAETGVKVNITVFGSNEEMFAKLQAGGTGWDVLVPTNYTIETYVGEDMFEPLDMAHAAELRPEPTPTPLHRRGHGRRQGLCRAQGLGHHRLRHQHRQGHGQADQLEGVLGPHQRRAQGPHHGA